MILQFIVYDLEHIIIRFAEIGFEFWLLFLSNYDSFFHLINLFCLAYMVRSLHGFFFKCLNLSLVFFSYLKVMSCFIVVL